MKNEITSSSPDSHNLRHTVLSLFPPYLILLLFFPVIAGMYLNFRLIQIAEPFITLSFIMVFLFLRYFTGKNIFYYIALVLVFINALMLLSHWIMVRGPLTSNSMYVVFNTNAEEAAGFLDIKGSYDFLLIIPFIILFILALTRTFNYHRFNPNKKNLLIVGSIICSIIVFLSLRVFAGGAGYRDGIPVVARASYFFYLDASAYKKLKSQQQWRSEKAQATLIDPEKPRAVVLIIGESLNRNHMSLYGYKQNTSPLLSQATDLIIYDDVISGYVSTLTSITGSLTETNLDNLRKTYQCHNIFDICHSAGVKSYWLSNQSPMSIIDNIITLLAEQSDKQVYLNLTTSLSLHNNEEPSYDSVLFGALHKALQEDGDHKFIVVHLLGSHQRYHDRYPSEFSYYKGSDEKHRLIAEYDNSVLYNDFVMDSLLKIMRIYSKESNIPTAAIYVADHGENVYDDAEYAAHHYTDTIYNSIVEIPYIVWLSPQYQNAFPERSELCHSRKNYPFSTDDNFHALIDILNIETPVLDERRSLFNPNYNKNRIRKKADGKEYVHNNDPITLLD